MKIFKKNKVATCRDRRINNLLSNFRKDGWYSVQLGFFQPVNKWDPHTHEHDYVDCGDRYCFVIRNGEVIYSDERADLVRILNAAGIKEPLPVFNGEELDYYVLSNNGAEWQKAQNEAEGFFYLSYYSVE